MKKNYEIECEKVNRDKNISNEKEQLKKEKEKKTENEILEKSGGKCAKDTKLTEKGGDPKKPKNNEEFSKVDSKEFRNLCLFVCITFVCYFAIFVVLLWIIHGYCEDVSEVADLDDYPRYAMMCNILFSIKKQIFGIVNKFI